MKKILTLTVIVSFLIAIIPGCGSGSGNNPEAAALEAANKWLQLLDEGKYDESWEESAGYLKSMVDKAKWSAMLQPVREPLGKLILRKVTVTQMTTSIPNAPKGQYVVIRFSSRFENKENAVETITPMLDKDDQWRVAGYYIK